MPAETHLPVQDQAEILTMARQVTGEVLETMFFSEAVPVDCNHAAGPGSVLDGWLSSRVCFQGVPSGELRVILSDQLARAIAAGFLGAESEDVTEETAGQVGCELGNMICGAILSRLHPDSRVALAPPELVPATFDGQGYVHQCFETPDGKLAIMIALKKG